MLKPHHRKNVLQGVNHTIIALAGIILALLVLRAYQTTAYLEEETRLAEEDMQILIDLSANQ